MLLINSGERTAFGLRKINSNCLGTHRASCYLISRTLHDILKTAEDPVVLSVACHDLGEFVHYHPRGRSLINQMDVKVDLMRLLTHTNADVQKHALFSLQKMMAHKWFAIHLTMFF